MSLVASFPEAESLGGELSRHLGVEHVVLETKTFPDGESYVRHLVAVSGKDVILVHRLYPDQDRRLMQLLLAIDAANDLGARRVIAILPYMAYSRQDRRFRDGEPISLKTVLSLLRALRTYALVTIDVHKPQAFSIEGMRCINVEPFRKYANFIRSRMSVEDLVVLSPDLGSLWRAERLGGLLGVRHDYLEKTRDRVTGRITIKPKALDVSGRSVVIIDDIIATGHTIADAASMLREQGAREIYVIATHCLMLGDAERIILGSGVREVVCSDTIETRYSRIGTADLIAEEVRSLLGDKHVV